VASHIFGPAVDRKGTIPQTKAMAARIKALVEPAMLVWARKTASLTQEEASVALDVPLERLQAWEKEGVGRQHLSDRMS
jgi:DNA-binding transcriptional regulator YiaG